ncbi:hypothetical protein Tco_1213879 [Tanacetum coccineum]
MASMNTRLNIKKLDGNIVQKHGGSKQVGFKQLGPGVETGVHGVHDEKRVWFEVELQGAQGDREAEVFQVSNDDTAVAQRWLEDKQPEEKTNTDCLVKEQEKEYQTGWKIKKGNNVDQGAGLQEVQTQDLMDYQLARDREQHFACELFGYREDNNEVAFAVAVVEKIYAHKSLTFNNTIACKVISKWKAGLKDDMDVRSDVYVLINGCRKCSDDNDGYYWEYTPDKANGNVLGMEIIKDQSGNTLRMSQFRSGSWIICRDYRQTKVVVVFDYAMGRSITVMGLEKEDGKGTLTESRHEAKGIAGIATGALVKGGSRSEVPAQVEVAAYRY